MYRTLIGQNSIELQLWESFLNDHPEGNIFQSPAYYNLHLAHKNYEPYVLFVKKKSELIGLMVIIHQKFKLLNKSSKLTSRFIIQGGPLIKNKDHKALELLLQSFLKLKNKALYTEMRNISDNSWMKSILEKYKFTFTPHLNLIHDLSEDENTRWSKIKSTRKKHINRSKRNNLDINQIKRNDIESFKNIYGIIRNVYREINLPMPNWDYFLIALNTLDENIRVFVASKSGKIIGARIVLVYKQVIFDWYAGGIKDSKLFPNDRLPWEIMNWGGINGYKFFDFGGAGVPNKKYGVRDFKIQFGGDLVNYGRYYNYHFPRIYKISSFLFQLFRRLK